MFGDVYRGKKVLVTGNTGFKGAWLSLWLLQLGAEVWGYADDIPTDPSLYKALELDNKVQYIQADIRDYPSVASAIETCHPDFVFHLAAQSITLRSHETPLETFATNSMGTVNLLEALRHFKDNCTAIIVTSDKCYLNLEEARAFKETDKLGGVDPYSASKAAAEMVIYSYARSYFNQAGGNIKVASARAGNIIGGGDWADRRLVPDIFRAWSAGEQLKIRNPQATRPWNFVLESLSGYLRLAAELSVNDQLKGEAFNFGPGPGNQINVEHLVEALSQFWDDSKVGFEVESSPFDGHEHNFLHLDINKASTVLQWQPVLSIEETARFVSDWYRYYYRQQGDVYEYSVDQLNRYIALAQQAGQAWTK